MNKKKKSQVLNTSVAYISNVNSQSLKGSNSWIRLAHFLNYQLSL